LWLDRLRTDERDAVEKCGSVTSIDTSRGPGQNYATARERPPLRRISSQCMKWKQWVCCGLDFLQITLCTGIRLSVVVNPFEDDTCLATIAAFFVLKGVDEKPSHTEVPVLVQVRQTLPNPSWLSPVSPQ